MRHIICRISYGLCGIHEHNLLTADYCQHPDNWQTHPVDLCNYNSCNFFLDKMFSKAYELKNIETSNIDLDTCVEIPGWRYWHLVVPFSLDLGKYNTYHI